MSLELPTQPDRYDLERRRLLERDIKKIAEEAQVTIEYRKSPTEYQVNVPFFSTGARLTMPGGTIECDEPGLMSFLMKLLLLHYLCNSSEHHPSGTWVSYGQLPAGTFYAATLVQNFAMLGERFGKDPDSIKEFEDLCTKLGGEKRTFGDAAYEVKVFPKVSTLIILHRGDEEFPPDAKVLIDEKVINFLQIDFVKLLIIEVINTLIRLAKK